MTNATLWVNQILRFGVGRIASAKPERGSLLCKNHVLGALVAVCAGVFSCASASAAENSPILKLGVLSDIHVRYYKQGARILPGLWYFRTNGVDAVCIPGDFTEYGLVSELKAVAELWNEVFPGDAGADGKPVAKLFIRGNHDKMSMKKDDTEERKSEVIGYHPAETWKEVLGIDWYTEKLMLRDVKGVKFVLVDWDATKKDLEDFLAANGEMLKKEQRFFFVQHAPPVGTVDKEYGGDERCGGDGRRAGDLLKDYPNCIALSGHSHYSITFADQIWQGEYLSVGCGCAQYVWNRKGRDNSWSLPKGYKGRAKRCPSGASQGQYILLYADRLVIERWDFANGEKVGPDQVIPFDGTKPFSIEEQLKRSKAPEFPKDAALAFAVKDFHYRETGEKWTAEKQLWVSYPRAMEVATDAGRIYEYECVVTDPEAPGEPMLVRKELANGYYLNDARVEKTPVTAFGLEELPIGKKLRFEVYPMDQFGNRGKAISAEYICAGQ